MSQISLAPSAGEIDAPDESITPAVRIQRWYAIITVIFQHVPFLGIICIAFYLLTLNLITPWQSLYEMNGSAFSSIAVNHIRSGLITTMGQDWWDNEAVQMVVPHHTSDTLYFDFLLHGPVHSAFYGHHPPLFGLLIAGSLSLFGFHFWAVRLVPIVFSLLALLFFYTLMIRLFDIGIARCASLIFATYPMFAYFGRNVAHESALLCCGLALLNGYVRWRTNPRPRWSALMITAIILGLLIDWPMVYFVLLLFGGDWLVWRRPDWRLARIILVPMVLILFVDIGQMLWILKGDVGHLIVAMQHRMGGEDELNAPITYLSWWTKLTRMNGEMFGVWTQYLLPVLIGFLGWQANRWSLATRDAQNNSRYIPTASLQIQIVVVLFAWALMHILLFRNGAFVHVYWQFYLIAPLAAVTGWFVVTLARRMVADLFWRSLAILTFCIIAANLQLAEILAYYSNGGQFPVNPWIPW